MPTQPHMRFSKGHGKIKMRKKMSTRKYKTIQVKIKRFFALLQKQKQRNRKRKGTHACIGPYFIYIDKRKNEESPSRISAGTVEHEIRKQPST